MLKIAIDAKLGAQETCYRQHRSSTDHIAILRVLWDYHSSGTRLERHLRRLRKNVYVVVDRETI